MTRLRRFAPLAAAALVVGVLFATGRPRAAATRPFVPARDDVVVGLVPSRKDPRVAEISALRTKLDAHPDDLETATALARLDIESARIDGDPRYLGHAEAAISHWTALANPPAEVLLLRATIRQSSHDFTAALTDLDAALALRPADGQAWLTRAVVLTVLGRYEEARASCVRLRPLTTALIAALCDAPIDGTTGKAAAAEAAVRAAMVGAEADFKAWALSVLGELALRRGAIAEAEASYRAALALDAKDTWTTLALADLLLDAGRFAEAKTLVSGRLANDAFLLRLVVAEHALHEGSEHADLLRSRYEAGRMRGDAVHLREEARFALEIDGDPNKALELAKKNWQVQHEPADARIYLEAAIAAKSKGAGEAVEWVRSTAIEDPRLRDLATRAGGS